MEQEQKFDLWCVVEIFGHQRLAGRVTEQTVAGQGFVRIDVPETVGQPAFSRLYGPSAIYSLTPVSEETARLVAGRLEQQPITVYGPELVQRMLPVSSEEDDGGAYEQTMQAQADAYAEMEADAMAEAYAEAGE